MSGLITKRFDIPVTTPARTIEDLEGKAAPHLVRRAIRQAELAKYRLAPTIRGDGTRSDLERDFQALCRRYGIPAPEVNVKVGRWIVDFLWREQRVAVETDFYDYHRGRIAFQDDRARELELRWHGLAVHRFSEVQIDEPAGGSRGGPQGRPWPRLIEWAPMAADAPELFLIDGNSLAYRAFFALPESIGTSDGRPTNAIYGLASMLVKIIDEHHPQGVVVAWDAGMSGREVTYDLYKAQRKPRPDLLREQWPHLMPLVEAFGYTNVKVEGYEADDVIASLTPPGARGGDRGDGRDRRPRRLPAGRRGGAGDEHLARDHRDQDLRHRGGARSATACRRS